MVKSFSMLLSSKKKQQQVTTSQYRCIIQLIIYTILKEYLNQGLWVIVMESLVSHIIFLLRYKVFKVKG